MTHPVDGVNFREVMSRFVTGVTVITSRSGEHSHGMTCNAFCSIALAPPTVLVSLTSASRTAQLVAESGVFAVNMLDESQADLSDRFAGRHKDKEDDRFEGFAWTTAATGSPVFPGSLAFLDCKVVAAHPRGDHTLFLGEVVSARAAEAHRPLVYTRSRYLGIDHLRTL